LIGTALLALGQTAAAAVSAEEAARLKTELTPFGGERAGNKEGTIPAWNGGYTQTIPGFENGGHRPDPFKDEKPLFVIDVANMDQYADACQCRRLLLRPGRRIPGTHGPF
jgi:hypothetical protein